MTAKYWSDFHNAKRMKRWQVLTLVYGLAIVGDAMAGFVLAMVGRL